MGAGASTGTVPIHVASQGVHGPGNIDEYCKVTGLNRWSMFRLATRFEALDTDHSNAITEDEIASHLEETPLTGVMPLFQYGFNRRSEHVNFASFVSTLRGFHKDIDLDVKLAVIFKVMTQGAATFGEEPHLPSEESSKQDKDALSIDNLQLFMAQIMPDIPELQRRELVVELFADMDPSQRGAVDYSTFYEYVVKNLPQVSTLVSVDLEAPRPTTDDV